MEDFYHFTGIIPAMSAKKKKMNTKASLTPKISFEFRGMDYQTYLFLK
jgi:hypothetical protein